MPHHDPARVLARSVERCFETRVTYTAAALPSSGALTYARRVSRTNEWGQPIGPELVDFETPALPPRTPLLGRYVELVPLVPQRHARELWRALEALPGSHWTYLPYGPFASFAEFEAWLERFCTGDDPLFFALVDREAGAAAGLASYLRIQASSACIEVGHLNFSPRLARRPAATEAMALMMQRAFELGYRRYEWKCDALHARSRAAAARLGFRFEGIFRNATIYKGRSRDTSWYSVIDSEWPALKGAFATWLSPDNFDAEGRQRSRLSELTQHPDERQR